MTNAITRIIGVLSVLAVAVTAALATGNVPRVYADSERSVKDTLTSELRAPSPDYIAIRQLRRLTLVQRASQLVMTSLPNRPVNAKTARAYGSAGFGGVIVFSKDYSSQRQLKRLLTSVRPVDSTYSVKGVQHLVSIDQEGGVVKRINAIPPRLSAPQLGRLNRIQRTQSEGAKTARALRKHGIQLNLAPVADVDHRPHRVMASRSFGAKPQVVARHVDAFIRGTHKANGATAVKHFPGLGAANANSDFASATIRQTAKQRSADLLPFKRAIKRETDAVMMAHALYPLYDKRNLASVSPSIYKLLRDELGYSGIAITDSLHAVGFGRATQLSVAQGCVASVRAGADIALLTGSVSDAVRCRNQLIVAVRRGEISRKRLDEAALRVLALKAKLGLLTSN